MMRNRSEAVRDLLALHVHTDKSIADVEKAHILRQLDNPELADRLVSLLRREDSSVTQVPPILRAKSGTLRRAIAAELGEETLLGGLSAATYWARQLDILRRSALYQSGRGTIESNVQLLLDLGARHPSQVPFADVPRYYSWSPSTIALRLYRQGIVSLDFEPSSGNVQAVGLTSKGVALVSIVSAFVEAYSPAKEESS